MHRDTVQSYAVYVQRQLRGGGTVRGFTIAPSAGRVQCRVAQMTGAGLFADCIVRDLGTTSSGFVGYQASSAAIISNCCFYGDVSRRHLLGQWHG